MLSYGTRPCLTADTMVAKLSSFNTIEAVSLATAVPATPIHTDVSALQRRRVIDPVARRRDHVAVRLQSTYDHYFVCRCNAGKHSDVVDDGCKLAIAAISSRPGIFGISMIRRLSPDQTM